MLLDHDSAYGFVRDPTSLLAVGKVGDVFHAPERFALDLIAGDVANGCGCTIWATAIIVITNGLVFVPYMAVKLGQCLGATLDLVRVIFLGP